MIVTLNILVNNNNNNMLIMCLCCLVSSHYISAFRAKYIAEPVRASGVAYIVLSLSEESVTHEMSESFSNIITCKSCFRTVLRSRSCAIVKAHPGDPMNRTVWRHSSDTEHVVHNHHKKFNGDAIYSLALLRIMHMTHQCAGVTNLAFPAY